MRRGRNWIIWYAIALHALWAILTAVSSSTLNITAISFLHHDLGLSRLACSVLFGAVAAMAAWGIGPNGGRDLRHVAGLLPQQAILFLSAGSATQAMILSRFADGVVRPWPFIAADQAPSLFVALLHTAAIVDFARRG